MKAFQFPIALLALISILTWVGCNNLQQDIDLDLPEHERLLNAECYILNELPVYILFLTETVGYYEEFDLPVIDDATVVITYMGISDTLVFSQPVIGGDTLLPIPVYFGLRSHQPDVFDSLFTLHITDPKGREIRAQTQLLRPIPFKEHEVVFNDKEEAYLLSKFDDPGDQTNYYRRILTQREARVDSVTNDTTWVSEVEQEFSFSDELQNGQLILLGTGFDFERGDTLITSLYHIEEAYNTFLETSNGAVIANFSPFAQPTRILTNIEGGTGIFTGIASTIDTIIIE